MNGYSDLYQKIRKHIQETWPQWKIDYSNSNLLFSAHPKKLERKEANHMPSQFTEIERKFLINSFPTDLPLKDGYQVHQAYLSIDPEVRIRRNVKDGKDMAYFLAIKSSGEMVRKEVEFPISKEHFYALAEMVTQPFITKDFCIYQLPNDLLLECSHVDKGRNTEFMYAEVEFPSVQAAENFKPLPIFVADVTSDSSYKMKNFWKRTRC